MLMLLASGVSRLSCNALAVMPDPDRLNTNDLGAEPACCMVALLLLLLVVLSRLMAAVWLPDPV